jgi:hypothetical protein
MSERSYELTYVLATDQAGRAPGRACCPTKPVLPHQLTGSALPSS